MASLYHMHYFNDVHFHKKCFIGEALNLELLSSWQLEYAHSAAGGAMLCDLLLS